jgi:hypothetical protein
VDELLNPIKSLTRKIHDLDDAELTRCLRLYLKDGTFGETPVYTKLERHRFIAELFNQLDTKLQERVRVAFSNVLESFEPANQKTDAEYLFYLVSLASLIRSSQTKERLRRWVRQGTFDNWQYDIFNMTAEAILALSAYDADDEWVEFLLTALPKRASFKEYATAAFRALWQTRGTTCLSLMPDVLLTSDVDNNAFVKSVGYLSRLVADTVGSDKYSSTLNTVFSKMQKPAYESWAIIVRYDYLAEKELSKIHNQQESLVGALREKWRSTISEWKSLPDEHRYEAFAKITGINSKLWQLTTSPRAAFVFRNKFILDIADDDYYIRNRAAAFFNNVALEEEVFYRTAGSGGR